MRIKRLAHVRPLPDTDYPHSRGKASLFTNGRLRDKSQSSEDDNHSEEKGISIVYTTCTKKSIRESQGRRLMMKFG